MNLLAGPQWRCRHRKQTCGHSGGRRKRKGRIESGIEAYTLPYVKYIASGNLLYDAWSSNLMLCDNLEGCDGVGGGREALERGDINILMIDPC